MEKHYQRVSVIIPFYKGLEWLDEAIESVLSQTYKPYEIIVVNDGSEESIDYLIEKYSEHVNFLYQDNKGAAAARNKGIRESSGDIVAFLDSDDLWDRAKLEKQISLMENGKYKWSATGYSTFGKGDKIVVIPDNVDGPCWELLYDRSKIATPTVAVRRELLETNAFSEDMRKGQDIYMWFRLSNRFPLGVVEEDLVRVRITSDTTASSVVNHVKVRSNLWSKMNGADLFRPKSILTKSGYKLCSFLDNKESIKKDSALGKAIFLCAWVIFRVDSFFQMKKLANRARIGNGK